MPHECRRHDAEPCQDGKQVRYAAAGADCLYAPGIREPEHIRAIVEAVAPKPVNLLLSGPAGLTGSVDLTMADAAALGVRRVSVGGALARAAWGGFIRAATELAALRVRYGGWTPALRWLARAQAQLGQLLERIAGIIGSKPVHCDF